MRNQLMERRKSLLEGIEEMLHTAEAANRDLTDEERTKRDANLAEVRKLTADIKAIDDAAELRDLVTPTPTRRSIGASHGPSLAEHAQIVASDQYRSAFETWIRTGDDKEIRLIGATTGPSGGYLVPERIYEDIWDATKQRTPVVSRVNRIPSTDFVLKLPTLAASGGFTYTTSDNTPADSNNTFGQLALNTLIGQWNIPVDEDMENSMVAIGPWLTKLFGSGLAKWLEAQIIGGAGSTSAITGIIGAGTLAATTASATAITRDEINKVYWSMPGYYIESGVWVMSSSVAEQIDAISNTVTGDALWEKSLSEGVSWSLKGRDVLLSGGAPSFAAKGPSPALEILLA